MSKGPMASVLFAAAGLWLGRSHAGRRGSAPACAHLPQPGHGYIHTYIESCAQIL